MKLTGDGVCMKGRIKYYNQAKGFGFIVGEDNNDYFMHISNVKSYELPEQGSLVEFKESSNEKGLCAIDIFVLANKETSSIIILGDVRIRKSNIKNYGITKKEYAYEKIYEVEEVSGKFNRFLFGDTILVWNGKTQRISKERYKNLKAVNDRIEYEQPGHMPFRAREDGICSTYKRYINSEGNIVESDIYTNEWTDEEDPPYVMKEIDCLYITTYQNDNYIFRQDESEFDVHEKCAEIDLAFS